MLRGVVCLVLLLCPLVVFGHAEECALWKGRASLLLPAFVSRFQAENGGFYKDTTQTVSSNYWYSPHALHTVVRASYLGLLNKTDQALFLDKFFSFHDTEGWYTPWIDDVSWMCEELVYALPLAVNNTGLTQKIKQKLAELGQFVYNSWDTTCCLNFNPGGAWWDTAKTYKACASNAGATIALTAVSEAVGNEDFLIRAQLVYEFWRLNQVLDTGQVLDGIRRDGTKDTRIFTYNAGMMLRATASLSKTNKAYLDYAAPILGFLLNYETFPNGVLREESPCREDDMDCQEFKGITFRYLIDLIRAGGVAPELRSIFFRTLENSVESIWNNTNGTALPNNWEGPAAMLEDELLISSQTSALNAILAWTDYVCGGEQVASSSNGTTTFIATTGSKTTMTTTTVSKTAMTAPPTTTGTTTITASPSSSESATTSPIFSTEPPTILSTTPPSVVLFTWQMIVSLLMSAAIVFVIGGVAVVLCLRCRRNRAAANASGELVVAEGFATDQEDNEDLFDDL